MDILLLTLGSVFALCALYGIVKLLFFAQDYQTRRRVFEHRVDGRNAERRKEERRADQRDGICLS